MKNGDIEIANGDIIWDVSDEQHIQDTINAYPGWWKENFSDGVGIRDFLNASGQEQILSRILKIQLESDQYQVDNPSIEFASNGSLTINPNAS